MYGLAHAPQADAQYPGGGGGGGGYPGGGGGNSGGGGGNSGGGYPLGDTYPGRAPNWYPIKPDGTPTGSLGNDILGDPLVFFSYDWTKLDMLRTSTGRTGSGQSSGKYPPTTSAYYLGMISSDNGGLSVSLTVSGTSTIKYQWVPPNTAAGNPDLGIFPAPTLYVFSRVDVSCYLTSSPDSTGLTGSGSVFSGPEADGWDPADSFTGVPGQAPAAGSAILHRNVLKAVESPPSGTPAVQPPAVVTMKPGGTLTASRTATGSTAQGGLPLEERIYPITLAAPDPFGRPDLGDGKNQFVYDGTPQGSLYIPGVVSIPGATADDTDWLLHDLKFSPHVNLTLALPAETLVQACFPVPSAGQIRWQHGASPYTDDFWYAGLPTKNSDFGGGHTPGYHLATMTVNGNISQQAGFQLFYAAEASNYPTAANDTSTNGFPTPDWYYYYNQAYTASGKYQQGAYNQTDYTTPYAVHIEDQSYGTVTGLHIYALQPGASYINYVGDLQLSGIWTYIFYNAHENEHHTAFTDGTYLINSNDPTKPWMLAPNGSHLDPTWAVSHYFDSTTDNPSGNTSSAPPYSNESDAPDDEAVADIAALGFLLTNLTDWQSDWAGAGTLPNNNTYEGGLQFGTSHFAVPPKATQPSPYFVFTPMTQNSNGSWIAGTPVNIWSQAGLQAAVPHLMMSLLKSPQRP